VTQFDRDAITAYVRGASPPEAPSRVPATEQMAKRVEEQLMHARQARDRLINLGERLYGPVPPQVEDTPLALPDGPGNIDLLWRGLRELQEVLAEIDHAIERIEAL
jgi:hypothetical protein